MISVIITAHNEGSDLEVTATLAAYGSIRPGEIIVVDDCSEDKWKIGARLDKIEGVRVIETPEQLGVAASRNFGALQATGDIIVLLDSHMRMPDWWLEAIAQAVSEHPSAIFCAACTAWNYNYGSTFYSAGAEFKADSVGLEPLWLGPRFNGPTDICPCILGACYIFPTPIWRTLRGFNRNFIGWGQDEQDISIRAWMFGFEVRRINKLVPAHHWDRTPIKDDAPEIENSWQKCLTEEERIARLPTGNFMNSWHPAYNCLVNCATVFEDGVFEQHEKILKEKYPDARAWRLFHEKTKEIAAYRDWVQRRRIRSDAEIRTIIGDYQIPPIVKEKA